MSVTLTQGLLHRIRAVRLYPDDLDLRCDALHIGRDSCEAVSASNRTENSIKRLATVLVYDFHADSPLSRNVVWVTIGLDIDAAAFTGELVCLFSGLIVLVSMHHY